MLKSKSNFCDVFFANLLQDYIFQYSLNFQDFDFSRFFTHKYSEKIDSCKQSLQLKNYIILLFLSTIFRSETLYFITENSDILQTHKSDIFEFNYHHDNQFMYNKIDYMTQLIDMGLLLSIYSLQIIHNTRLVIFAEKICQDKSLGVSSYILKSRCNFIKTSLRYHFISKNI